MDEPTPVQYPGPTTTAKSAEEGRLKVDAGTKRKIIRKKLKKGRFWKYNR